MTMRRRSGGGANRGLAELLEHHLGHVHRGVEAHEVQEGERAHGVAASELHRQVDVLLRGDAGLQQADRLQEVRHEEPVHDEPRGVLGGDRRLAERLDERPGGLEGRVPVRIPCRMTSTSFITGAGLKKWSPRTCGGRFVAAANSVIVQDEVFDARMAWGRADPVQARERLLLERRILGDRLDDQVRVPEILEADGSGEPVPSGVALGGLEPPLLDQPVEAAVDSMESRSSNP